jgi:hypothetical protein
MDVQNADIEAFNNNIEAIREYIQRLETKVEGLERVRADLTTTNTQLRDVVFKNELFKRRLEEERSEFESRAPRWISVEDRLPEDGKDVLIFVRTMPGWLHMDVDWRDGNSWHDNTETDWNKITHWMPLPEAPKEE